MIDTKLVINEEKINYINFDLKLSEFYKIWLLYIIKSIFTLEIYSFWGATKVRTYLTNKFSLDGERFIYTGTAKELFFGFLTMFMIIESPNIICYLVIIFKSLGDFSFEIFTEQNMNRSLGVFNNIASIISEVVSCMFFLMCPYWMIKYRASRISWKGMKAKLGGSGLVYMWRMILNILAIFSLNIFTPYTDIKRKSYIWNNLSIGTNKFNIYAKAMPLMKINFITTLLLIPTLAISRFWYYAALDRYIYSKLEVNGIKFHSIVTGGKLAKLCLGNILLFIVTLGLATPWIIQRNLKFYVDNHTIIGDLNNLDLSESKADSINKDYSFYMLITPIEGLGF